MESKTHKTFKDLATFLIPKDLLSWALFCTLSLSLPPCGLSNYHQQAIAAAFELSTPEKPRAPAAFGLLSAYGNQ